MQKLRLSMEGPARELLASRDLVNRDLSKKKSSD